MRPLVRLLTGIFLLVGVALVPSTAYAADDPELAAEIELAQLYAPRMSQVAQLEDCGDGEPYAPSDVDPLFANPEIALRGGWAADNLVKVGPTDEDLGQGLPSYSLDFPGDPLSPGCDYEEWFNRTWSNSPATIYAHVAKQEGIDDRLALQYYFYYPFNDYNNTHESDWERIQLEFDVGDAQQALDAEPVRAVYGQHEGSEFATWGDEKLEIVDSTHPVVYVSEGSHASQFVSGLVIGRNAEQGFGCDNTAGAQDVLEPDVGVLSADDSVAAEEYPWIDYEGRWGELGPKSFYDAPTGPKMKDAWTEAFTWSETARESSFVLPGVGEYDGEATDIFCSAVALGSDIYRVFFTSPLLVLGSLALVLLAVSWLIHRTSWEPIHALPAQQHRSTGQIVADSWEMYRKHWWLMFKIGSPAAAVAVVSSVVQPAAASAGFGSVVALVLGAVLLGANSIAHSGTAYALSAFDVGETPGMRACLRRALDRGVATLGTLALFSAVLLLLGLSIWLLPIAFFVGVGGGLWNSIIQLEGYAFLPAFRRSWQLVRRQFWTVTALLALAVLVGSLVGGVLVALLFVVWQVPAGLFNLLPGLISTVLQPFIALMLTYAYYGGRAREEADREERAATDSATGESLDTGALEGG